MVFASRRSRSAGIRLRHRKIMWTMAEEDLRTSGFANVGSEQHSRIAMAPKPPAKLDLAGVHRYYLETSTWNLLRQHPHRDGVLANIRVSGKRCAVPSIINAAELLRTSNAEDRADLCRVMAAAMTPGVVLLPHPTVVLKHAVADFRRGKSHVTIPADSETATLQLLIEDPSKLEAGRMAELDEWADREKGTQDEVWKFVTSMREPNVHLGDDFLAAPGLVTVLSDYSMAKDLALTPEELRELLGRHPVWAAFGLTLGLAFDMFNQVEFSKKKAGRLPNGPDHLQLVYLPLVNEFVTDDGPLFQTARRAMNILGRTHGCTTKVRLAADFFRQVGYPHPERK
jgi:hypothetical protein